MDAAPYYESAVWRPVSPPKRVRIDLQRAAPALLLGSVTGANPILRATGLRHVEAGSVGALHAWVRTHHGLWIGRCVIEARIGQSHTVLLEVWAPADTIQPEPALSGPPNTQRAVSSGASAYYYEYDSTGAGTLRCCPDGQVAHTDPNGHVHCGHKGEIHRPPATTD